MLPDNGMITWFCPFVIVGLFVSVTQLSVISSEFSCKTKPGIPDAQERVWFGEDSAMLNIGVVRET